MKSPKDMKIIQIDITNACIHTCSNCTRMCGHHEKPYMMDFSTFRRAVDSLEGFAGTISMMGGEPTLHPEFEKFARYLQSKYPHLYETTQDPQLLHPMTDFMKTVQDMGLKHTENYQATHGDNPVISSPGLFSAMGSTYLKHFEVIQEVFKMQGLNDHSNEMYHQPSLVSRKDLGISDDQWIEMRDKCWLQNTWSASVTPKGAFFCEIAGAMDMLFDGPGGWPIEKDWWKRDVSDFADQLHWCESCGFACETFTRNANDEKDDVSASLYERLQTVNSPKVKSGRVNVIEMEEGQISEKSKAATFTYSSADVSTGSPYIKYKAEKFSSHRSVLYPQNLVALYHFTKDSTVETMEKVIDAGKKQYKTMFILGETSKVVQQWESLSQGVPSVTYSLEEMAYGHCLNKVLPQIDGRDYLVMLSEHAVLTDLFVEKFKKSTANPGVLITSEQLSEKTSSWVDVTSGQKGYIGILNSTASSLSAMGFDGVAHSSTVEAFFQRWKKDKTIAFDGALFVESSKEIIKEGERCAIFGGGGRASDMYYLILQQKASCVAVVDSDPKKQGNVFEQLVIQSPDALGPLVEEIDRVLIGTPIFFEEMKEKLLELGFTEDKIGQI